MTGTLLNALAKETMAKMINDLEENLSCEHNARLLEKASHERAIEQAGEQRIKELQKLHKDYGEEIVQLKDEHEEEIEQYKNEIECLKEDHDKDIHDRLMLLVNTIEDSLILEMKTELAMSDNNLECQTYRTLYHFMETMDDMLSRRNITNNCKGRVLAQIREFLSKCLTQHQTSISKIPHFTTHSIWAILSPFCRSTTFQSRL